MPELPEVETKPIFNGKDLAGWTIHGTEKWYVEQGELICESGPEAAYGYLSTKTNYDGFELHLDSFIYSQCNELRGGKESAFFGSGWLSSVGCSSLSLAVIKLWSN